ncbi:MAG: TMEM165/GDT1 family protein [Thermoplasmata archaeon]|nr:MAG: TMEM165/GDT1 family protein [Thermoplasmata archaeon]
MAWYVALGIAFATVALAELADKTQLVCISQACRYPAGPVLAGSAAALIVVTAIGVAFGSFLYWLLPPDMIGIVAGALFLAFGVLMVLSWYRDRGKEPEEVCEDDPEADPQATVSNWSVFGSTFGLVALAELGDKTQLAVIALSGKYGSPLAVFLGASIALVAVSTAGVMAGRMIAGRVSLQVVELVAAALFIVLGVVFLLGGIPGL